MRLDDAVTRLFEACWSDDQIREQFEMRPTNDESFSPEENAMFILQDIIVCVSGMLDSSMPYSLRSANKILFVVVDNQGSWPGEAPFDFRDFLMSVIANRSGFDAEGIADKMLDGLRQNKLHLPSFQSIPAEHLTLEWISPFV